MFKFKKLKTMIALMAVSAFALGGCGQADVGSNEGQTEKTVEIVEATEVMPIETTPVATLKVKDFGTITLNLYPEMAPNTVNNFIQLANGGFYDGLGFHRIIQGFMIQGGDPEGTGAGGPDYSIAGEFAENGFTQNTLSHTKGVISMARTQVPDSAGSQFFIMSADGDFLDGQYAAFGEVTDGLEVVEAIEAVQTGANDAPVEPVIIESVRVETNGVEVPGVVVIR